MFLWSVIDEKIKNVIFDFGGVIINIDYNLTIEAFKKFGIKNFEEIYSQADQTNLFDDIETGKISPQHFINELLRLLPKGISPNQVVHAWNEMLLDIPKERIELLNSIRAKYRIYLLSNTNSIHIDAALRTWNKVSDNPIESTFDKVYLSFKLSMRKPNAEIFNYVCEAHGLEKEETLFIDDSIQHVEGAQKAGLQALHLSNGLEIQDIFS
ncbi:MAG: HAD family phosphatase [Crocinitomicaceae bacterium]|nr:HAD family phosphatase [Crocinitomicaceae bacterium]